jgi:predicted membrane channel-forming protein YqfA (hemolysin III family)
MIQILRNVCVVDYSIHQLKLIYISIAATILSRKAKTKLNARASTVNAAYDVSIIIMLV